MGSFRGIRMGERTRVLGPSGAPVAMRHDLKFYSERHDWGYGGTAPSQLALDLAAARVPDREALAIAPYLKRLILQRLPKRGWSIEEGELDRAIQHARAALLAGESLPAR